MAGGPTWKASKGSRLLSDLECQENGTTISLKSIQVHLPSMGPRPLCAYEPSTQLELAVEQQRRYYDEVHHKPRDSRTYRLPSRRRHLDMLALKPGDRFLDVATGVGSVVQDASDIGAYACGLDFSMAALSLYPASGRRLVCADVTRTFPFRDNVFDAVSCLGSLENIPCVHHIHVLNEIVRVSRPGARVRLLVDNSDYFLGRIGYRYDTQPVVDARSVADWLEVIRASGLRVLETSKSNAHLSPTRDTSTFLKFAFKVALAPLLPMVPLKYSYQLAVLCEAP